MSSPLKVGPYHVRTIKTGTFCLDGGAMFGNVPKSLWQKKTPADAQNRIQLATRSLWIEEDSGQHHILVDVGNGDKFDAKDQEIFGIHPVDPTHWGVPLDKLTDVILTHLHFDHAGGISRRNEDGSIEPVFPEARVHLQRSNLENARAPTPRERASYLKESVAPLTLVDLHLVDGDVEILPDIRARVFNGHTHGLQAIQIGNGPGSLAFPSDLIPTANHIHLPWIMGYDRCAELTLEEKSRYLKQAVEEHWVVVFEHDPDIPAATITQDDRGRFGIDEIVEI